MQRWIVEGTDRTTGEAITITIPGISRAHAEVKAIQRNLSVLDIRQEQLVDGDDEMLGPVGAPDIPITLGEEIEVAQIRRGVALPAWFTPRRCKLMLVWGSGLLIAGIGACAVMGVHEYYAAAAAVGVILAAGGYLAGRYGCAGADLRDPE